MAQNDSHIYLDGAKIDNAPNDDATNLPLLFTLSYYII